ncbi:MAG: multidrug DMT transporter permease [Candidatus Promineifilaceae bacterium]
MTLTAAALIITSAFMHAGWNYVSKRRSPSLAFFWIAAISGALVMTPNFWLYRQALGQIPPAVWGWICATGVAQAIYVTGLAGAYKRGDISLAYPLARALPVLFVAVISILLGKGDQIRQVGLFGMALISIGCVILPLKSFRQIKLRDYFDGVYAMALVAAIGTTGYSLIDDQALRLLRQTPTLGLSSVQITLLFISFQVTSTAVMLSFVTWLHAPTRRELRRLLQDRALVRVGLLTGVVIMATYGLVLAAMGYVTNVSYVAAFRQLSIPIGAMMGLVLQNEPRFVPKLIGIGIVSIGLILVGFG